MIFCWILFSLFVSTLQVSTDVIAALASINAKGYPESILYETVSGASASGRSGARLSKEALMAALTSPEVENRLRVAAMEYAMSKLMAPQQRQLMESSTLMSRDGTSNDCSYSWWSWVPWANCPAERTDEDTLDPNSAGEIYAKCFR